MAQQDIFLEARVHDCKKSDQCSIRVLIDYSRPMEELCKASHVLIERTADYPDKIGH
jgi:hypothetical protein